jgi:hypothetical protein
MLGALPRSAFRGRGHADSSVNLRIHPIGIPDPSKALLEANIRCRTGFCAIDEFNTVMAEKVLERPCRDPAQCIDIWRSLD